jgi:hypothetical protein
MKVQIVSKTGVGSSAALVINTNATPVNLGFAVVVSGTVNYDVQYSFDNPAAGFVTWFASTVAAQTDNQNASILFPVSGIKLVVNSGTGTATMSLVQAGIA